MYSVTAVQQSVLYSLYLLLLLVVTTNCQIFNITDRSILINNVNEIMKVLRVLQSPDILETIKSIRQQNIMNSRELINNTKCTTQIERYYNGTINMEFWALQMLDASSKIPSGILKGNLKDIGMYDECLSVRLVEENMTLVGRHCMYTLSGIMPTSSLPIAPTLSICVPSACSADDIHYLLQSVINTAGRYMNGTDIKVTTVTCSNVDAEPFDTGAIITIVVLGILICFMMICTILECLINQNTFIKTDNSFFRGLCKFSLYANGKRILSTTVPRESLPAITGLRFFSMCWVIFGHSFVQVFSGVLLNLADLIPWVSGWDALSILIAPFAVDTFFVLSGFLTSYLFMKEITKRRGFSPILYYVHRYIRLTPALGALILLTIFILPRIGSGALWQTNMSTQKHYCTEHWWNLLLYIQNYRKIEVMACLGHTWYLAVDMQLFWISPLILYPLAKKPKIGIIIFVIFLIASIVTPTVITLENEFSGGLFQFKNMEKLIDLMSKYYIRTYIRATPWLMGVFLGYKLSSGNNSPGINIIRLGWILTLVAFVFIIFTYRIFQNVDYVFNVYWEGFYAAFSRVIWGFGVCWIIYASAIGYGGFISNFLSSAILLPFSRISYSVYLVHWVLQGMKASSSRAPQFFSYTEMIHRFLSDLMLSSFVGFFFCLLFESPFLVLEKMLLMKYKQKKPTVAKDDIETRMNHGIDNHAFESNDINHNA